MKFGRQAVAQASNPALAIVVTGCETPGGQACTGVCVAFPGLIAFVKKQESTGVRGDLVQSCASSGVFYALQSCVL